MKTVANREVRDAIKHSGAYQYEIAYAIGISEAISDETAAQILPHRRLRQPPVFWYVSV